MSQRPNVLFLLVDQLRLASLPIYGETQIETPHIDRLAREGVVFDNMVSSCPVCTPFRSMMLTGRHPQTTGHLINFMVTRHDEIGLGDAFANAGYRTGWIGKWHLHRGAFPQIGGKDFVPAGRDRLGFDYWRGYNFHTDYFDGWVNCGDWHCEQWQGYETDALNRYAFEFMDTQSEEPFMLFISPHQPHYTPGRYAPQEYYDRLPKRLILPENAPDANRERAESFYRHYLAMVLALDDMLGDLLDYLDRTGLAENTLVIFSSDHGSQFGAQGIPDPFQKMRPYDESFRVPMIARWPGVFEGGGHNRTLTAPVDLFPTLCGLCDVDVPRSVEGHDLSDAWRGEPEAFQQDAVLTMNFTATYDWLLDGKEWRGLHTGEMVYTRWLSGLVELFDLRDDPLQMRNLALETEYAGRVAEMEARLQAFMAKRHDDLVPCHTYEGWYDNQRRVVRNAYGALSHPESEPDWSLLSPSS